MAIHSIPSIAEYNFKRDVYVSNHWDGFSVGSNYVQSLPSLATVRGFIITFKPSSFFNLLTKTEKVGIVGVESDGYTIEEFCLSW